MRTVLGKTVLILCVAATVAACSRREPDLMNFESSSVGPDEFSVLPTKPLEAPENFSDLPDPTPGGANRTDPTPPHADAVAALGGNPERLNSGGATAGGESALIAHASRMVRRAISGPFWRPRTWNGASVTMAGCWSACST